MVQKYSATLTIHMIYHKLKTIAAPELGMPAAGNQSVPRFPTKSYFKEEAHAEAAESVYGDPEKI